MTEFNRQTDAYVIGYAGNEPEMDWAYGDVCLVVRVGKEHAGIQIDGSNSSKCSNTEDNINPTPLGS